MASSSTPTPASPPQAVDDDFTFDGLNPRAKSKPGEGPGEIKYPKIAHPITGRPVTNKPANGAFLKHARWKAEQAALEERRAKGIPDDVVPSEPWTAWRFFKTLVVALMGLTVVGKFITGSPVWGYEQQIAKMWKETIWKPAPIVLNHHQLARYTGADANKPVYLAIDSVLFDVSANRRVYGPGGSYNMMTGKDASRAFVTGCFQPHHLTHDLRGLTDEELVGVANWKKFFTNNPKYSRVGTVLLPPIDPSTPIPGPCIVEGGVTPMAPGEKGHHGAGGGARPVPVKEAEQQQQHHHRKEL
ncbi:cytochrome b5-like heme/steroid binding domain-containing protein [Mrakia frigida]|uniref:cytochrome b5-like heme/steroid binding domain-containing protein n=1 Tax=Mrakia frigida TaxID=29902 RepID=UPI003FCC0BD0